MATIFGNNLKSILNKRGLTQRGLATKLNVTEATVSNWVRGVVSAPREQRIRDMLCSALDASEPELFGYKDGYASRSMTVGSPIFGSSEPAYLPYLGYAHAGEFADPMAVEGAMVEVPKSVADRHPSGRVIRVDGDCVSKVIPNGSIAVVDPDVEPRNGSLVCASIDGGDCILRRMFRGANTLILSPDSYSPEYEDIVFSDPEEHDIELVGTVVWHQAEYELR